MKKICIGTPFNYPSAGSKARKDAIRIVGTRNDYKIINLSCFGDKIHISDFHIIMEFVNLFKFAFIRNSIIFTQEPLSLWSMSFLFKLKTINKNKIILLSHDFDYIRYGNEKRLANEVRLLNIGDCIISANKSYTRLLRNYGVKSPIIESGTFDYIIPDTKEYINQRQNNPKISFVGNLEKSIFLERWIQEKHSYSIELIGSCSAQKRELLLNGECTYKGSFSSDTVPFQITGSYGLVWDGSSINTCDDVMGDYLKYNSPHKFSLYLAALLPVITWRHAAIAEIVEKLQIGIVIDSIEELDQIIPSISDTQYQQMINNIRPIQQKILNGDFLHAAVKKAEQIIQQSADI